MKRELNRLMKASWFEAAKTHHAENTHKRFTPAHAREAGYAMRKGQGMARGSRGYARSYYGRKERHPNRGGGPGRADPLVFMGRSQQASRFPSISSTATRARIRFKTPAFNFRHPKSRVRMSDEFRKILPGEKRRIVQVYDGDLDQRLSHVTATQTTRIG